MAKAKTIYLDGLTEQSCKCTMDNFDNFIGYYYAYDISGNMIVGKSIDSVAREAVKQFKTIVHFGSVGI